MWRRLVGASVWARGAIDDDDIEEQLNLRFFLPVFDIGIIILGFIGAINHVPALDETLPHVLVDFLALMLSLAGFLALVGVTFPRLRWVEIGAKYLIIIGLLVYPAILISTGADGQDQRLFAGWGLMLLVLIPMTRVVVLPLRMWKARLKARETAAIIEAITAELPQVETGEEDGLA